MQTVTSTRARGVINYRQMRSQPPHATCSDKVATLQLPHHDASLLRNVSVQRRTIRDHTEDMRPNFEKAFKTLYGEIFKADAAVVVSYKHFNAKAYRPAVLSFQIERSAVTEFASTGPFGGLRKTVITDAATTRASSCSPRHIASRQFYIRAPEQRRARKSRTASREVTAANWRRAAPAPAARYKVQSIFIRKTVAAAPRVFDLYVDIELDPLRTWHEIPPPGASDSIKENGQCVNFETLNLTEKIWKAFSDGGSPTSQLKFEDFNITVLSSRRYRSLGYAPSDRPRPCGGARGRRLPRMLVTRAAARPPRGRLRSAGRLVLPFATVLPSSDNGFRYLCNGIVDNRVVRTGDRYRWLARHQCGKDYYKFYRRDKDDGVMNHDMMNVSDLKIGPVSFDAISGLALIITTIFADSRITEANVDFIGVYSLRV
ncbi:hypothetical protein EVAR_27028_1 [Eumeta japonica]|uniref:Uncharacterized protein n=1 Tax=Eumeta variegata TaxID=151549 RepID=A0A4C1WD53_EUMVA|nr:hypothetical protein EVAR_27028_1 [Eumeta japonica]